MTAFNLCGRDLTTLEGIDITPCNGYLDFSFNLLENLDTVTLPSTLKILNCRDNLLSSLNAEKLPLGLQELRCCNNLLTSLPDLSHLKRLKVLDCGGNQITFIPDQGLPPNLVTFYCDINKLTIFPDFPISLKYLSCLLNPCPLRDINSIKLSQHNKKRKKLGLELLDKIPKKHVLAEINERYIISQYEPGGDMFEKSQQEIQKLLQN